MYIHSRPRPSFPTRRSSDLRIVRPRRPAIEGAGLVGGVHEVRDRAPPGLWPHLKQAQRVVVGTVAIIRVVPGDRKSTRLNSSHVSISYAVRRLKKKTNTLWW